MVVGEDGNAEVGDQGEADKGYCGTSVKGDVDGMGVVVECEDLAGDGS